MIARPNFSRRCKLSTIAALLTGAVGVAILWAAGVSFPTPIPPGIVLLGGAAVVVTAAPWRWGPGIAVVIGLYICTVIVARGVPDLRGDLGAGVAIGRWIQLTGSVGAVILGSLAVAVGYRSGREEHPGPSGALVAEVSDAEELLSRGCWRCGPPMGLVLDGASRQC
jgi:hypothetical protein